MLIKHAVIGLNLMIIGIVGSITSFILLNTPELTAALVGLAMVGAVMFAIGWEMPEHPIKAMREEIEYLRENIERMFEELNILDVKPSFLPSSMSKDEKPSIIIPLAKHLHVKEAKKLPERFIITIRNIPYLKLRPPCTKLIEDLAVSKVENVGQVEDILSKILVQHLNIADSVKVAEKPDNTILVVASKMKYFGGEYRGKVGFTSALIGTVLAETLGRKIDFINLEIKGRDFILTFK